MAKYSKLITLRLTSNAGFSLLSWAWLVGKSWHISLELALCNLSAVAVSAVYLVEWHILGLREVHQVIYRKRWKPEKWLLSISICLSKGHILQYAVISIPPLLFIGPPPIRVWLPPFHRILLLRSSITSMLLNPKFNTISSSYLTYQVYILLESTVSN